MDEQLVSALSKDPFFIERYELLSALGSGGMGWVVKARDKTLANEIIALKLLYPHLVEDPQSFARFRNEVLVARRLVHPNIVRTYNFFSSGNHGGYIVMECVEGQTLAEMLETPALQLDFKEAIRILYLLSAGLSYAHAQGIIHRDLKPGNVLIREDGAVKLSDFGLAQVLRQRDEISTPGMLVGTPHYMAPEQFCNQTLDERTDIYAFGVLAYEMIAGRVPYDDASVFALAEKHLTLPLPKDQAIDASPKWFRELLQRCTEKQKADRLQSMAQVMAVLAAQVDETLESSGDENPVTQLRVYTREREILRMWKNPKLRRQIRTWVIIAFFSVSLFAIRTNPATRQRVSIPVIYLGRALGSELVWLRWFLGLPLAPSTTLNNKQMKSEQWTLLRTGADPNVPGFYPLHSGIGAISRTRVLEFLRFGADPNRKFPPWNTAPLHLLRGEFGLSLLEPLLDAGGDINIQDFVGSTPLHYAMREADLEMVKAMLKHGANPNQADSIGNTPLMYALRNGSLEQVRLLVEAGAKTDGPELDAPLATLQRELRTEIKRVLAAKRSPLPASVPAQQETK